MKKAILGVFNTYMDANAVYTQLMKHGYSPEDLSIITKADTVKSMMDSSKEPVKGIATAATVGGVVGGLIGLLTGIGAITIPGIGALFIAGPLATAIGLSGAVAATASAALTGVLAGGMLGALKSLGLDEIQAMTIENKIKTGHILLVAGGPEESVEDVKEIFEENFATDINVIDVT